jgi:hypothetical protein
MVHHLGFMVESLTTDVTEIRLQAEMEPLMVQQVVFMAEGF